MDRESVSQTETLWELLRDQLNILLSMIPRPVVQQQIITLLFILLVSWLLPEGLRRWRRRRKSEDGGSKPGEISRGQRWQAALYYLFTPLLALILLNIAIWLFAQQARPYGLLQELTNLVLIWLVYRGLLTLMYARFGESSRPYRNWIVTPLFFIIVVIQIFAILPGSITLRNATISIGTISVPLASLITAALVLYLFIVAAWVVKQMMVQSLPHRLNAEPGVVESIATLTRYFLLTMGIIFSLGVLGLDFTSLAIVAGGLSVGIGIGLQDIVSNFVSGLILLFEQTLRPGDVVELEGRISRVEQISLRATTVRTRTNEELIIPNSRFTSEQVKNLTRSDRMVLVLVPLGVSYKSDPRLVRQLAVDTALQHPLVLTDPPPGLIFRGYGDSSLDFNLSVSINQPEMSFAIRSDLYYLLWDVFAEHGIEIPFPQRDLNLGDGWEKFTTRLGAT